MTMYALIATFVGLSIATGVLAASTIGPRRLATVVLPSLAAFSALYLVGHRLGMDVGPTVILFGFEVALPFDIVVAVATAFACAWLQRAILVRIGHRRQPA